VAAWVIGSRSTLRALLLAMLEPLDQLCALEQAEDYTGRLALLEAIKSLPLGAVWDMFCVQQGAPVGAAFMDNIRAYEKTALAQRG
jgi:L-rhamnose isomerase